MVHTLISGAGIAGPALAYWLQHSGHDVTVVERAPSPRTGGQAVDLRGAGRTVIERMGLMPAARAVTLEQRGISFVDTRGRARARMPVDAFGGEGIVSEIEILREDLAALLIDAADVEYMWDDTVTGVDQDDDGVDVTFARAAPRRFDLVVGADGLYSAVRALAFGPGGMRPLGAVAAWFTAPDPGDLDAWYVMHNAPGGRVASLRPGRVAGEAKAGLGLRVDPAAPLPRDAAGQKDLLERRFAGVGWKAPALVAAMRTASDFAFTAVTQVHLPSWSRGRVVLVGDAAASPSPLTGLGTSVALVQAYVLAGELARGDHRAAFARYEEICRPYVTTAQELPPGGVGGYAPTSAAMIRLRTASMGMMTRWPMKSILATQFAKAADVRLPDYARAP